MKSHTWESVPAWATVLVPVGSFEQHGPHLPLDTDTAVAAEVADRAARALSTAHVVVAPAIPYGSSGEHQAFPGTMSIGTPVLTSVLVELGRSLRTWAAAVVFVNGHGGNLDAVTGAVEVLRAEGQTVAWFPCASADADPHAGWAETSVMLRLRPQDVRSERARPGNCAPLHMLLPALREQGLRAVTANGVLGDPSGADADAGEALVVDMVATVANGVRRLGPP
nr:mycofactocin biosynthesis peptidyl-dipeptidase MftE [Kineococcus aurantiacus]